MSSNGILSASILSADFTRLGEEVNAALEAGVDFIHFDVMDHHYVPNLSFGPVVCRSLRHAGITAPIDVHLMVTNPEAYIESFAKAGANYLTFHAETANDIRDVIAKIRDAGMKPGLAFNPDQSINLADDILQSLDLILLMSVFPGFAGQNFIEDSIVKIGQTRQLLNSLGSKAFLGVDGGIKVENIGETAKAGADFFVVGSGLFHSNPFSQRVKQLRQAIKN